MPDYNDPAQRIDDLLDQQEVRIARLFRSAIASLKDDLDLDLIAQLLAQGRLDDALDQIRFAAEQLGTAANVTFVTAGQSTADFLTGAGVGRVVFDQVNTMAVAAMQANRLLLIREFTDEQRRATSLALIGGVESGINPLAQARKFRDSIGLTERGWAAIDAYRKSLEGVGRSESMNTAALTDPAIRRAIRDSKPLTPEYIDKRVDQKIAMAIKRRSETIGRTEALRAVHEGNEEMYRQAIAAGTINAEDLSRKWVTRLDGRERATHEILNGQEKRWGEPWVTIHGPIRYPGDSEAPASETIQCRCAIATRIRRA